MDTESLAPATGERGARPTWLKSGDLPAIALALIGATFAFETTSPLLTVANILTFTNIEILVVAVAAIWFVTLLDRRRRPQVPLLVITPALAWLIVLMASTASAPGEQLMALRFTARMAAGVLIGWICYDTVASSRRPQWIACSLALGGCLVAAFGIGEALNVLPVAQWLGQFKYAPTRVGEILRISSTLSYATIAAMVLELTFPLLLAWFITTRQAIGKLALALAGTFYLIALVLTLSRAGVIALGAALIVVLAVAAARRRGGAALASSAAIGMLGVLAFLSFVYIPGLGLRLTSENDESWYRASLSVVDTTSARPGERLAVPVTISNTGMKGWDTPSAHPFALGYHLYGSDHSTITYDGARTWLTTSVPPGATVTVSASVAVPNRPGEYEIAWDLVQEDVAWFSWKGSQTTVTKLIVAGAPVSSADNVIAYVPPPRSLLTIPIPGRIQLWTAGLAMLHDHPLLGVGPDNFRLMYGPYAGVSRWNMDIHANNLYVELLADTGLLGFAVYAWLAWRILSRSANSLRRPTSGTLWVWQVASLASLVAWFVHGLFDYFYEFTPTYLAFSMVAGLALGLAALGPGDDLSVPEHANRI